MSFFGMFDSGTPHNVDWIDAVLASCFDELILTRNRWKIIYSFIHLFFNSQVVAGVSGVGRGGRLGMSV